MSQINDALRRAGHVAKAVPPPPPPMPVNAPPPPPPLPPTYPSAALPPAPPLPSLGLEEDGEAKQNKSSRNQILLALLLIVCVTVAAAVTFWEKRNRSAANAEAGAKKVLSAETIKKTLAAQSVPAGANTAASNVFKAATPPTAAAPVVAAAPVTPPRPVEPVKFPPLRLQSIFYRPSSPSVMINNKTLFIDDTIQGVQVADIQPSSVTLVLSGQTNILTLR
jgi:hypothetical protein